MTVPFLEGFTAITGPNGSGKSNIADAIMFVLGPKSPKAIRAGRLTDLIFNGGKGGRPEKYCKVSLVFANEDRLIPIDDDEIKLTRMVKFSPSNKESYYSYFYVNGRASSLTEFNDLLANAKITADGYNFVMQGDINAITRMSPLERRRILEDVAGITRFDKDIDLSERKRTDVEENLKMIQLTLNEIGTELRRLEKDRKAALKYMEYKERWETSKAYLAHKKVEMFEREISAVQEQTTGYETELEQGKKRVEELRATLEEVSADLEKVELEIVEKGGDEARELKEKIDEARLEIARAKDAILTSKERVREMKVEKTSSGKDLATLTVDLKRMGKEADGVRTDHEARKKELDAKRKE
jgi:chromosome segregation protein